MKKVTKAVIPAAGFGTRFLPATKAVPKEMIPIVDTPTIQYIVEEAVESGIKDLLIVTGRGKDAIMNHFDRSFELETILEREQKEELLREVRKVSDMLDVHFIRQKEQKGLGNAAGVFKSLLSYNITRRVNCPSCAAKLVRPPYRSEMAQMLRTPSP